MNARDAILTAVDFESTGSVRGFPEEPWQIGLVEIRGGRVTGQHMESLLRVDANRPFNPYAPGRHASLRPELAVAPTPAAQWPQWRPWIEGPALVAHNIATEQKFLRHTAPMTPLGPWIDTLTLARHLLPGLPAYGLAEVCAALGLLARLDTLCPGRTWHDALYDAFACALVLEYALASPAWGNRPLEALAALPAVSASATLPPQPPRQKAHP